MYTTMSESHEVHLAIYDLSHGMARQLSAQFLGPQYAIDIIPHTAVIVYGREFFFGGGIQHEDPIQFRRMMGIQPVKVQSLGRTNVSRVQFELWCQESTRSGRYTAASYDLLQRNCNNFSHDAALQGLKLVQGVPDWILDVPRKFLSSPMGQMVRPMLENMQVTGNSPGVGSGAAPFANAPTNNFNAVSPISSSVPIDNPWAKIPSKQTPTAPKKDPTKPPADRKPLLDSFHKPLISSDSKTVILCIKKLIEVVQDTTEKQYLVTMGQTLSSNRKPEYEHVQRSCEIVLSVLQQHNKVTTFALMFLRVLILHSSEEDRAALACLDWIKMQLSSQDTSTASNHVLASHTARSMAWTTLSNAASLSWWKIPENFTEIALMDLAVESQPRPEVRQAVAAFLYNLTLKHDNRADDELSDMSVSILCATMEDIVNEPDATTCLRRLLVGAHILAPEKKVHGTAKHLFQDLGFQEAVQELSSSITTSGNTDDAQKCKSLAVEILDLFHG